MKTLRESLRMSDQQREHYRDVFQRSMLLATGPREWTEIYLDNLPEGMLIQHPDIQSPFDTAHLVRGDDILLDFYDDPAAVARLPRGDWPKKRTLVICAEAPDVQAGRGLLMRLRDAMPY